MLLSVDRPDAAATQSISFDVIAAVAEREGIDPMDLEPPEYDALYEVINPEALDALFAARENGCERPTGRVEFPYCGYHVVVTSDREVTVSDSTTSFE
ncbi:HalOD1 output domain-containing protein [Natrinema gelatinilyticum]|uniref:HalOD1 output domain-containing protein n=1 Tax=Natrinema gelatinilyticum TaxID=2961571 RepID=UPI0020C1B9BF|nr:HalOD1 output domain-containing protein [Natrinema gelatinilyticum]